LTDWFRVSSGGSATAAIKTNNTLWTWGLNNNGQLGQNNVISRSSPVQVGALTDWRQVSTTGTHMVAVKTDGTLWAWGYNNHGQLGNGTAISRSSPVQIGALTNWSQVSAGQSTFSLAVKTDGTLWAWGRNNYGQLGDGTVASKSSPVQIGALASWTQVSGGSYFGSALYGSVTN
jgi:alpha-tubulin suppressor-like RCC1 family protein